ncbi:uncharacterized protein LOC114275375 [Camellia sinensis]|uniref:uncharacterized protein LOC114275375 n=1 Tax=Camellia sinensis TaxID=4442 RepID=UPI001036B7B0|nr:uncharacterized protein LOC114275375 [Camellia sinensis]
MEVNTKIDDGEGIYEVQEAQSPIATRSMASICPSFFRTTRQRIFDEMIKPHVALCSIICTPSAVFQRKKHSLSSAMIANTTTREEKAKEQSEESKENHVLELLGSQLINHQPNNYQGRNKK